MIPQTSSEPLEPHTAALNPEPRRLVLPGEVEDYIFDITVDLYPESIFSLLLVSKYAYKRLYPLLYRIVSFPVNVGPFPVLPTTPENRHLIKHLLVFDGFYMFPSPSTINYLLCACPNLEGLALWDSSFQLTQEAKKKVKSMRNLKRLAVALPCLWADVGELKEDVERWAEGQRTGKTKEEGEEDGEDDHELHIFDNLEYLEVTPAYQENGSTNCWGWVGYLPKLTHLSLSWRERYALRPIMDSVGQNRLKVCMLLGEDEEDQASIEKGSARLLSAREDHNEGSGRSDIGTTEDYTEVQREEFDDYRSIDDRIIFIKVRDCGKDWLRSVTGWHDACAFAEERLETRQKGSRKVAAASGQYVSNPLDQRGASSREEDIKRAHRIPSRPVPR